MGIRCEQKKKTPSKVLISCVDLHVLFSPSGNLFLVHLAERLQFETINCSPPAAVHVVTKSQNDLKVEVYVCMYSYSRAPVIMISDYLKNFFQPAASKH